MTAPTRRERCATPAFVAVVLLSLVVLFAPDAPSEHAIPNVDKVVHATLFLLLAATTWWRFDGRLAALASVVGYGGLSEVIQSVALPSRDGDVRDVLADAPGALLGWVVVRWISGQARPVR